MKISANLNIALKSASYYRKTGILVALGLALAGAVTTGSLIIGDCVKGSIRHVALARLGGITHSIKINGYARAELADDISKRLNEANQSACPAILTKGVVENQDSGEAAPIVNIIGIDARFASFYGSKNALKLEDGKATLNAALAKDLSVKVGDSILVTTDKQSAIPTGSLFAHIDPVQNQRSLRLEVKSILSDTGPGGFRMDASTQVPRNVLVSLSELSKAMEKPNKANTIFLHSSNSSSKILETIKEISIAQDYGVNIKVDAKAHRLIIQSDSVAFPMPTLAGVSQAAKQINQPQSIASVYLANSLVPLAQPAKTLHYCVVAAVDPQLGFDFIQGGPITTKSQIIINSWAAQDLGAKLGDKLAVSYLVAQPGGKFVEHQLNVTVHGIVNIDGPAADSGLVPTFEGITDAERIGDWQPPFPVDLKKVTPRDEAYWDKYKAIPKAFLHPDDLQTMWSAGTEMKSPWVTGVYINPPAKTNLVTLSENLQNSIARSQTDPPGLVLPLRQMAFRSAQGSTDLAGVFFGLGMLLIYACAVLAGSFIRISALSRVKNIGIMLAEGFTARQAGSVVFWEWMIWILAGSIAAVPLGVLYAWAITIGLNSWWQGAVGQSVLWLHVTGESLISGFIAALAVGIITLLASLKGITKRPVVDMLHDRSASLSENSNRISSGDIKSILICAALVIVGIIASVINPTYGLALAVPISLPVGTVLASVVLTRFAHKKGKLNKFSLATQRQQKWIRHDASVQLAAAAVILIVVSSQIRTISTVDKNTGTGGFSLRAICSMPLGYDLNTPQGRSKLGFQPDDEKLFKGVSIYAMPAADGDDISCLNLAKPGQPRILGLPDSLVKRGGFGLSNADWNALKNTSKEIPAFGDADSVEWNLKKKIGDGIDITSENGNKAALKISGVIKQSIFAGELLVPEKDFVRLFPNKNQPRYYLIECPVKQTKELAGLLRQTLGSAGLEVRSTTEIVNSFLGVQNTYIAVLMALGGLALLLGAGGQVIGVLRSVSQHKNEYALMASVGFNRMDIAKILVIEHAIVPGITVIVSAVCCILVMLPGWISGSFTLNWLWPAVVLPAMAIVSLATCSLTAMRTTSQNLIDGLRSE